ncbi:hypothetical protein Leryth_017302 [Lithospermum erythrorhizon]|nr:hypothetical protein Leryth_017302 [Lithospermum erythrorhizon]
MVGLKVVLEGNSGIDWNNNCYSNTTSAYHQVVSKASMIVNKTTSPTSSTPPYFSRRSSPFVKTSNSNFLDNCFLCRKKLLPCHDIYMYKGDRAFCSEECRCRQIYMDEEEAATVKSKAKRGNNCSFSAINKPQRHHAASSSSPASPSSSRSNRNKSSTKRSNGFVY